MRFEEYRTKLQELCSRADHDPLDYEPETWQLLLAAQEDGEVDVEEFGRLVELYYGR